MAALGQSFNPLRIGSFGNRSTAFADFGVAVSIPLESGHLVIRRYQLGPNFPSFNPLRIGSFGNYRVEETIWMISFNPLRIGSFGNQHATVLAHARDRFNPLRIGSFGNR